MVISRDVVFNEFEYSKSNLFETDKHMQTDHFHFKVEIKE